MTELQAYIKANCKTGLDWKVGGGDLSAFSGGGAPAPAAAPKAEEKKPEPAAEKPKPGKAKKAAGAMSNVFAQMKKGGDKMGEKGAATSAFGLKKVRRDQMAHKRRADGLDGFSGPIKASKAKAKPKKKAGKDLVRQAFVDSVNDGRGPDIITSNIDAMNIEMPDFQKKADADGNPPDPVEMPVPEQFITRIDLKTQTIVTEEVKHG